MIFMILLLIVAILILLVFVNFWAVLLIVIIGAGIFAIISYLLRRIFEGRRNDN